MSDPYSSGPAPRGLPLWLKVLLAILALVIIGVGICFAVAMNAFAI